MVTMLVVATWVCGLIGIITGSALILHHWLKKKEAASSVEALKMVVFPEMEAMTERMLQKTIKTTMDMTVDMVKKMQEDEY